MYTAVTSTTTVTMTKLSNVKLSENVEGNAWERHMEGKDLLAVFKENLEH